ncbi:hypothetical protein BDV41DRAFT_561082 [Aspergillus transmontanensis]|uniref:Uncharacterized protein n=1 Tax=Aspergillus transmontanensis TaxID=1034304 RepID=A0A5N6WDK0_9EURO|nr:hypothetical protein BDV41DRAFT_561082 [Aspergillus transmontanensis]
MGPVESISSRRLGILIRSKMSLVLVPTNIIGTPITRISSTVQHDSFKSNSVIRHRCIILTMLGISIGKLGGSTPSEGPENLEPSLDALARGNEAETSLMSGQSLHGERLSWLDALCNRLHVQMTAARDPITHFEKDLFRKASAACATAITGK